MDLKISKKENSKWISRWINNVNTSEIGNGVITTTDFQGKKQEHTFDPSNEWITEVKYFSVYKPKE